MGNAMILQQYVSQLPEHAQNELFDFAEFLIKKYQSPQVVTPRQAGLHQEQTMQQQKLEVLHSAWACVQPAKSMESIDHELAVMRDDWEDRI